ncbi:MAG: hypothetical protein WC787_00930 [Patescibacteria group bacterium]|jgi:photosystem II stability/assembly factor-like uncharacterized protein
MQSSTRSFARFAFPVLALVLFGQGCFGGSSTATGPDGGVWKTTDRGQVWANKRALVQGAKITAGAAALSINDMAFDPQDANAIYLATAENGMVYSLDAGDSWQQAKVLNTGRVNAVAVDPKNKCTVYATRANEIYKTETCGRDWAKIFFDPRTDKAFTQIVVDWFNPTILYAGTSEGDIFKSTDAGRSWQASKRIEGTRITHMVMDPRDSRALFVGTGGDGLWKTADGGVTWTQIKKQFGEDFRDARNVTKVVLDPSVANVIYIVSKYGIIKSDDGGTTWKGLNLTAPPGTIKINALVIDATDNKKMIYTGPNTLTFTSDGGVTWTAKKPPTTRAGSALLIDPKNGNIVYLGTVPVAK